LIIVVVPKKETVLHGLTKATGNNGLSFVNHITKYMAQFVIDCRVQ